MGEGWGGATDAERFIAKGQAGNGIFMICEMQKPVKAEINSTPMSKFRCQRVNLVQAKSGRRS